MKNKSLAKSRNVIPYVKDYRVLTGSVTATILIVQLDYWFEKYPDGFYKFLSKSEKNPFCKDGDSWTEELGFSEDEFRTAFDKVGTRYNSKKSYNESDDKFKGKYYCSYHDKIRGFTMYFRNHGLLDNHLDLLNHEKSIPRKQEMPTYGNGDSRFTGTGKANPEDTEITQSLPEITSNIIDSHESIKNDDFVDELPIDIYKNIEKTQSLTTQVKQLFDNYYFEIYGEKFSWGDQKKSMRYGKELRETIANAGNYDDAEILNRIESKMVVLKYMCETNPKFDKFNYAALSHRWNEIVIPADKDSKEFENLVKIWNKLTGQELSYTPAISQLMSVAKVRNNLGMLKKAVVAKALNEFDIKNNTRNLATLLIDKSGQIATYAGKYDDQKMSGLVKKKLEESHDSNSPFPEIAFNSDFQKLMAYDWTQHGLDALAKYVVGDAGYQRIKSGEPVLKIVKEIMDQKILEYAKNGLVKNGK